MLFRSVPEYLIKGIVSKAEAELTTMSKGVHVSSGCECVRYRSKYVCITVKGSRVCEHCNVLAVRKYVRASMV